MKILRQKNKCFICIISSFCMGKCRYKITPTNCNQKNLYLNEKQKNLHILNSWYKLFQINKRFISIAHSCLGTSLPCSSQLVTFNQQFMLVSCMFLPVNIHVRNVNVFFDSFCGMYWCRCLCISIISSSLCFHLAFRL